MPGLRAVTVEAEPIGGAFPRTLAFCIAREHDILYAVICRISAGGWLRWRDT
jgi:hypothetical protein